MISTIALYHRMTRNEQEEIYRGRMNNPYERKKRQKKMPNIRCLIPRDIERPINSPRVCLRAGSACSYFYSLLSARQQVYLSRREQDGRENESRAGHLKYRSKCNTPRNLLNVLPARQYRILDLKALD